MSEMLRVKRITLLFVVSFLVVVLPSLSEAETITYTDKLGRKVTVNVPVKRTVFFTTYELIPALEIWDSVIGIGRWAYDDDLMKATKPDIASTIPSTGSGSDVNIEVLVKLKPDLVITWTYKPETIRFMEDKGLKVIAIYPEGLYELYEVMRLHGRLFKKEKQMEYSIAKIKDMFRLIRERVSKIRDSKKKKVLWLGGKPTSVACGIGVTNDIFKLIGGVNSASSIPQRSADIPMERIVAWNPDVIFISGYAGYTAQSILQSSQWRFIKAVREGRVYKAPKWSTWSPRLAPIALWMALKTYPEYFKDINLDRVSDDFYRKVFGIQYNKVKKFE